MPKRTPNVVCAHCGTALWKRSGTRAKYCGWDCYQEYVRTHQRPWCRTRQGYLVRSIDNQVVYQHRVVMEEHLGRPLWPDESVHHVNGDRADNRLDNLELWSKAQPAGQRVEDKVAWAREILARYT